MTVQVADVSPISVNLGDASGDIILSANAKLGNTQQPIAVGKASVFEKAITVAANTNADVTIATITSNPCQIESVVIHAVAAQTANLTSCGVFGGAAKVVTFISAADAIQASLAAIDAQLAWTGSVRLGIGALIVTNIQGTGAAALNLIISIKYRPCVAGGYLA